MLQASIKILYRTTSTRDLLCQRPAFADFCSMMVFGWAYSERLKFRSPCTLDSRGRSCFVSLTPQHGTFPRAPRYRPILNLRLSYTGRRNFEGPSPSSPSTEADWTLEALGQQSLSSAASSCLRTVDRHTILCIFIRSSGPGYFKRIKSHLETAIQAIAAHLALISDTTAATDQTHHSA